MYCWWIHLTYFQLLNLNSSLKVKECAFIVTKNHPYRFNAHVRKPFIALMLVDIKIKSFIQIFVKKPLIQKMMMRWIKSTN